MKKWYIVGNLGVIGVLTPLTFTSLDNELHFQATPTPGRNIVTNYFLQGLIRLHNVSLGTK